MFHCLIIVHRIYCIFFLFRCAVVCMYVSFASHNLAPVLCPLSLPKLPRISFGSISFLYMGAFFNTFSFLLHRFVCITTKKSKIDCISRCQKMKLMLSVCVCVCVSVFGKISKIPRSTISALRRVRMYCDAPIQLRMPLMPVWLISYDISECVSVTYTQSAGKTPCAHVVFLF